jgi:hypothetical protein
MILSDGSVQSLSDGMYTMPHGEANGSSDGPQALSIIGHTRYHHADPLIRSRKPAGLNPQALGCLSKNETTGCVALPTLPPVRERFSDFLALRTSYRL